jgi:citrate synthase
VSFFLIFENYLQLQLKQFEDDIRKHTLVNEEMKSIIDGFPRTAHPMGVLAATSY